MSPKIEEIKNRILSSLKTVYDPEIPVNIVDLGLIYELKISEEGDVYVRLGATSPFCPVIDYLALAVEEAIREAFNARSIRIDLDLETLWTPLMMTEEVRKTFKEKFGYDILEVWKQRR